MISHDITTLANDLADADKIVQDYVSFLRDAYADDMAAGFAEGATEVWRQVEGRLV